MKGGKEAHKGPGEIRGRGRRQRPIWAPSWAATVPVQRNEVRDKKGCHDALAEAIVDRCSEEGERHAQHALVTSRGGQRESRTRDLM